MKQKVVPVLQDIGVQYEVYRRWMKMLENHCVIHTEFYPERWKSYTDFCLLLSSDYRYAVTSLFSLFPTTPVILEMGGYVLAFVKVTSGGTTRLFWTIRAMRKAGMIGEAKHAVVVSGCI